MKWSLAAASTRIKQRTAATMVSKSGSTTNSRVSFVAVAAELVHIFLTVLPLLVDSWSPTLEHHVVRHLYGHKAY
jgi:hypothetical protein